MFIPVRFCGGRSCRIPLANFGNCLQSGRFCSILYSVLYREEFCFCGVLWLEKDL